MPFAPVLPYPLGLPTPARSIRQLVDLAAAPLRDREMKERYLEVPTLASRALPAAGKAFVRFLTEHIKAG